MPEQVQNILNKITEWWKKFNTKQKALLISIVAVIIVALAILAAVVNRTWLRCMNVRRPQRQER